MADTQSSSSTSSKPEAPADKQVEILVDGKALRAAKGANLLEVMLAAGIEISYFCYHPGLSVVAQCRQCLVGLKGAPKLAPACQTPVTPGMEVDNSSPRVLAARRQMLEFTLVNHPIDCPICDKAGECALQKQYMDWDSQGSRIDHAKVRKGKRLDLGPRILLDQERCILCTRCVRFCAEVARSPQLVIAKRGHHSVLTTAPGHALDNPYALNTVDICPVGALTDKDFRFQIRVWQLAATQSVCNGCATGCRCEVHHHRQRIYRVVPRRTQDIDHNWMCDFGRTIYKEQAADRLTLPRVCGRETGWDEAIAEVAAKLAAAADHAAVGFVLGADATNEDNYVAARLALDFLKLPHVYLAAEPGTTAGDTILRDDDPNPNRAGALACARGKLRSAADLARDLLEGKLQALYVVGDRLHLPAAALDRAAGLSLLAVQAAHGPAIGASESRHPLVGRAHVVLPACVWEEVDGTITNRAGLVQRLRAAVQPPHAARPHWEILVKLARRMGLTLDFTRARDVFEALRQEVPVLQQGEWGKELPPTLLRFAGSRG